MIFNHVASKFCNFSAEYGWLGENYFTPSPPYLPPSFPPLPSPPSHPSSTSLPPPPPHKKIKFVVKRLADHEYESWKKDAFHKLSRPQPHICHRTGKYYVSLVMIICQWKIDTLRGLEIHPRMTSNTYVLYWRGHWTCHRSHSRLEPKSNRAEK